MRIDKRALIVGLVIMAIVSLVVIAQRLSSKKGSVLTASNPKCLNCVQTYRNDKTGLCSCLSQNGCSSELMTYCRTRDPGYSPGNSPACKSCISDYGTCMSGAYDYKKCNADLCSCLTNNSCDQALILKSCNPDSGPPAGSQTGCIPADGVWSKDGQLAGPCCVPSNYQIYDSSYKTCQNYNNEPDPIKKNCLANCCKFALDQASNYDPSWAPMAQCACSLCCNNADEPHFSKFGTCVHYISGDKAEAETPDSAPASQDWRGWIDFKN